jgi:signal transduction histidine kinase
MRGCGKGRTINAVAVSSTVQHPRRAAVVDGLIAAVFVADVVLVGTTDGRVGMAGIVGGLVATASVTFRRHGPQAAVVVALVGSLLADHSGGAQLLAIPLAIALNYYTLGERVGSRGGRSVVDWALVVLPLPGVATSPGAAKAGDLLVVDIVAVWAFFMVLPWVAGRVVGARRRLVVALRESADRLADEQRQSEAVAAADERARIARELHDVIAHCVSVMVIQTQAARLVAASDRAAAVNALGQVERCGRDALFDVRRMVGVLRRDGGDLFAAVRPGVAQLADLIDRTRVAGLPVVLRVDGTTQPLPPSLDLVVYRVVQEALTNALKHAGTARARVALAFSSDCLDIDVTDTGGGNGRADMSSSGHGLIGMRERLHVYGGRLEAGPLHAGGYRVHATIPLTPVELA